MHVEVLGKYELVLSAMQSIQNGGWTAYAAVRSAAAAGEADEGDGDILPYQRVASETLFASEAAALAGARHAALEAIAPGRRAAR